MAQEATVVKIQVRPVRSRPEDILRRVPLFVKNNMTYTDTTVVNLFEIPGNVLVKDVYVRVTTAFDASGTSAAATLTVTMPNDTGTEVLFDSNLTLLQSTGFKPSTTLGISPSSGGYVIVNYTAGTTTAGAIEVYMSYVELADRL